MGLRSPSTTALPSASPRPRASAMLVPTWGLNCRCSWARRRWFVPCSSQRRLRGLPSAALCCASRSPTIALGTSTPAPDCSCPARPQSCPCFAQSGAGRGLKVCSSCRRCVLRASNGFPARNGGDAGGLCRPKPSAALFRLSKLAEKLPRSVFRLAAGVAPYPMKSGQPRAQLTVRAAFGYSRGDWDSTRTLRGRFARAARIGRPSIGGASGR